MFYFERAIDQQKGSELPVFLPDGEIKKRHLHGVDIIDSGCQRKEKDFYAS